MYVRVREDIFGESGQKAARGERLNLKPSEQEAPIMLLLLLLLLLLLTLMLLLILMLLLMLLLLFLLLLLIIVNNNNLKLWKEVEAYIYRI